MDESFIDFAESECRYTLLDDFLLEQYPNLIVIKSISKSYGVPGLRLGILASSSCTLIKRLWKALPIWNINSFAEYFLQIYSLYKASYTDACDQIARQRKALSAELEKIPFLKVYPSQANYIMCKVTGGYTAKKLATLLLSNYKLLIKDLSGKYGFDQQEYIRIAVKNSDENKCLISALNAIGSKSESGPSAGGFSCGYQL